MSIIIKKFLGDGPFPFSIEKAPIDMELYLSDDICIIVNRNQLDMPALSHCHSSYEFTISYSQNIGAVVEKKTG